MGKMSNSIHRWVHIHGMQEQEEFQTVLRAAGETETTRENIQDWLQLDEGHPDRGGIAAFPSALTELTPS
jgi:hypothetical protein